MPEVANQASSAFPASPALQAFTNDCKHSTILWQRIPPLAKKAKGVVPMKRRRLKQLLFFLTLIEVYSRNGCVKARSEEPRVVSCPTSIKDGRSALVFTRTGFGWQAWCGFKQQTFCDGTFNWLPMDKPEPEDGRHVNDGMQQWAFYPNGTTMVTFGYTCKRKKSK
jgi:hypothetical protein